MIKEESIVDRPSLRAQRSNPAFGAPNSGLLRCARNDGYLSQDEQLRKSCIYLLLSLCIAIVYFFLSIYLLGYYTNGDQLAYTDFYDLSALHLFGIKDLYSVYHSNLTASDPIYFLIVYLFAPLVDKIYLIASFNAIFAFLIFYLFLKNRVAPYFIALFLTYFYFIVLLVAAERLKFGFLLLILAAFFTGYKRYLALFLSVLGHFQMLILYVAVYTKKIIDLLGSLIQGKVGRSALLFAVFSLSFLGAFLGVFSGRIVQKLASYSTSIDYSGFCKAAIFMFMSAFYAKKDKSQAICTGTILAVFALFLGGNRIVILSYAVFLCYGLRYRRGYNLGVLLSSLYFSTMSLRFIENIIEYGNGYYSAA